MSCIEAARRRRGVRRTVVRLRARFAAGCSSLRIAILTAAVPVVCIVAAAGAAQAPSPEEAVRGAAKAHACGKCHGTPDGAPSDDAPTLAGQQSEFLVAQMFFLREGLRDVPEMAGVLKGFTDQDLTDIAAHFALQAPPRIHSRPEPKLFALGERISITMGCGSCHFSDYRGQRQVPRLTTLREDFLYSTMKAYRDNKRVGVDTNMNAILARLSDTDIRALAHYFAHYLVRQTATR